MLKELIAKNRSYRRFQEDVPIDLDTLRELVDLARHSASAANMQPLRYILACDASKNEVIFPHLAWAAYLTGWAGPAEGERPSAYIVILGDTSISRNFYCDHGIAAQSILLGATERGFGGCMIWAIRRDGLRKSLRIPDHLEIMLVLALGKPNEEVVLEPLKPDGNIKYWRDADDIHHVPKRALDDMIIG